MYYDFLWDLGQAELVYCAKCGKEHINPMLLDYPTVVHIGDYKYLCNKHKNIEHKKKKAL